LQDDEIFGIPGVLSAIYAQRGSLGHQ